MMMATGNAPMHGAMFPLVRAPYMRILAPATCRMSPTKAGAFIARWDGTMGHLRLSRFLPRSGPLLTPLASCAHHDVTALSHLAPALMRVAVPPVATAATVPKPCRHRAERQVDDTTTRENRHTLACQERTSSTLLRQGNTLSRVLVRHPGGLFVSIRANFGTASVSALVWRRAGQLSLVPWSFIRSGGRPDRRVKRGRAASRMVRRLVLAGWG